ncbi:FAD-binding protein [Azospirillum sp. RWY-5-1]|uniref:FAD-binding protein n=1 Tax=Azospirillum oleiclasticum TaxID=2735135 RepID=A0ABX2TD39_9PROT|nr:FAD-binding protein [Azospirillum oleiclasticum]NYZ15841.1 FAD-binding protein [Azospirillum oleiclasticum]NYZ22111.1 FAD-binding protein [Azospirillum oleiclasticum]
MSSEAQVLAIGSAAAGMVAAVEAAELGANTLLLGSEAIVGGSTALTGGHVRLCETESQPGSRQELLEALLQSHAEDCQEDLSRLYAETAPVPYRRLKALGCREVSAPTLDALLAILQWECGVDAGPAATTVDLHNRDVRVGGDRPSDRRTMVGDEGVPLAIDASMRVINACGEPTDRLFAAGEVTDGSHGAGCIVGRNTTAKAQP